MAFRDGFGETAIVNLSDEARTRFRTQSQRDVSSIAFSPDGQFFATVSDDGDARVFRVKDGEPVTAKLTHETKGHVVPHYCRYSDSGRILMTWGASDRAVRLWDPRTGEPIGVPLIGNGIPKFAQIQPGEKTLITIIERKNRAAAVQVWSLSSFDPVSPEMPIALDAFDLASVVIPDDAPFSLAELDEIEVANGQKIGKNGLIILPAEVSP